ncbi:MAG: helix-turn-helix domain-containing protein [Ardenticatenaceae bacterium]|nr:helix-turn-helix domain-containing protein [Anaerolineales bacterium]MCB8921088.1 helix-turn-helix domain-containing protein [Ardenticatenaceae bacterium]MCB9005357.1 helix-turn-helix domain-containing protein [Ardenticatenaceae bacterium]
MLQEILSLFRQSNGIPLSASVVARQLGLETAVVEQLLHTLVQRGRLTLVDEGCTGCTVCPLKKICAGAPTITQRGYALVDSKQ